MHPELITIGGFTVASYGVMNMLGYLAAVWYLLKHRDRVGVDKDTVWNIVFVVILSAILGGKLFYALFVARPTSWEEWREFFENFRYGFVFFGGFVVAVTALAVYFRRKKLPLLKMGDYVIVALPLGHALGRVGCFLAGCCYGKPWNGPWAVTFTNPHSLVDPNLLGVPLHPTQLYEVFANLIIFTLLHFTTKRKHRDGTIVLLYAVLYSAARFIIEFFRGDYRGNFYYGLSPSQLTAVVIVIIAAAIYFGFIRKNEAHAGKK